jgi:bifunctional UDP-N-acetylglucosamine pyrophosphorylase/glucosamine-1-phosphate N-acetyltransferase
VESGPLCGDAPLIPAERLAAIRARLAAGSDLVVLGFEAREPSGYGRILLEDGAPAAIREEKDASEAERAVTLCNSGVIGFLGAHALTLLEAVGNANAKREFYLTDVVALARARGLATALEMALEGEVVGVNDRVQLAAAEALFQRRAREAAMRAGATLIDPATVTFSADTRLGEDVVVEPNVVFGPGVTVGEGARIHAFCHLESAAVGAQSVVGPYARLRPGAQLGHDVHIGNFVEVKNSTLARGAKANHLAYLGDADVGERVNYGAGSITANYDGANKHRTVIGADVHVGSNCVLVAPVTIGAGATIGGGSTISKNAPAGELSVARAKQVSISGWQRPTKKPAK